MAAAVMKHSRGEENRTGKVFTRCVITQQTALLSYLAAEVRNNAKGKGVPVMGSVLQRRSLPQPSINLRNFQVVM